MNETARKDYYSGNVTSLTHSIGSAPVRDIGSRKGLKLSRKKLFAF